MSSWNSYLVLKIWKPYVVRIYPRSTFLLIPCEGWERRQNSRAKNYDESKSASMRPIHAVLLWDFGGFGVLRFGKIEVMRCMKSYGWAPMSPWVDVVYFRLLVCVISCKI